MVLWALAKLFPSCSTAPEAHSAQPLPQPTPLVHQPPPAAVTSCVAAVVQHILAASMDQPQRLLLPASPHHLSISLWAVAHLQRSLRRQWGVLDPEEQPSSVSSHLPVRRWAALVLHCSLQRLPHFGSQVSTCALQRLDRPSSHTAHRGPCFSTLHPLWLPMATCCTFECPQTSSLGLPPHRLLLGLLPHRLLSAPPCSRTASWAPLLRLLSAPPSSQVAPWASSSQTAPWAYLLMAMGTSCAVAVSSPPLQELANLLQGAARLRIPLSPALLHGIGRAVCQQLPTASLQDAVTVLWALAIMRTRPDRRLAKALCSKVSGAVTAIPFAWQVVSPQILSTLTPLLTRGVPMSTRHQHMAGTARQPHPLAGNRVESARMNLLPAGLLLLC